MDERALVVRLLKHEKWNSIVLFCRPRTHLGPTLTSWLGDTWRRIPSTWIQHKPGNTYEDEHVAEGTFRERLCYWLVNDYDLLASGSTASNVGGGTFRTQ